LPSDERGVMLQYIMDAGGRSNGSMWSVVRHISTGRWLVCNVLGAGAARVRVSSLGGLKLQRRAIPQLPGPDWVRCKTRLGGICGTDLSIAFLSQHPATMLQRFVAAPVMLGHESVAEIVDAGAEVTDFNCGDRVVVDPPVACAARGLDPPCRACRAGRPSICENFDKDPFAGTLGLGYGNVVGGSWSEYFVAHRSQLHRLPDTISDEQGILIDPLACSLHGVLENVPANDERIVVFGAGIIGLACVAILRALRITADITMTVRHPYQAELARRVGADRVVFWREGGAKSMMELAQSVRARVMAGRFGLYFLQRGFDRVYDCTGLPAGFAQAGRLLRPRGRLIVLGTPQLGNTDLTSSWLRELNIFAVTGRAVQRLPGQNIARHNYEHIIGLIQQRRINIDPFAVRLYRQHDFRTALLDVRQKGRSRIVKAAFDFRT